MEACIKHSFEPGIDMCRRCGGSWCKDCLVYAFGEKNPPFCMSCAMVAGGVRTTATRPALPKRELKALRKAINAEAKTRARSGADSASEPEDELAVAATFVELPSAPTPAPVQALAPAPAEPVVSGWETPWWEDRVPTLAD